MPRHKGRNHGMLKSSKPKTTLMDRRVAKPANKKGKQGMVYQSGKHG